MRTTFVLMAWAAMFAMPGALAGSKKDAKVSDPTQLVWPLPPDKPRFRWVEILQDTKQFESRKFSFIDRLAGDSKSGKDVIFRPIGVATDSKGRVIITGQLNRTVYVIDKDRKQVLRIRGTQSMEFKSPIGVMTDDKDNIYVADSKLKSVMRFAPDGTPNASFGQADGLENPSYMAFDAGRRRMYVTDTHNHQVFVYNVDTLKLETKFGKHGTKKGELGFPVGVAVSPKTGDIAVTNTQTCSVEIFTPEYKWKQRVGECGNSPGNFTRPKGVAFDQEGNIYVVDNAFNNFQVFDGQGHLRLFVGSPGVAPGNFWLPNAIYIDKNNKVYVSEFYGNRVQVFQFLGSN
ncbi:MAG TPA: 6-bladed beta-propeller [Terriglobales bacterium]|nr:6-bladed beta-propeller [Terriglobales bacterium]